MVKEREFALNLKATWLSGWSEWCSDAVRMQVKNCPGDIAKHFLERGKPLAIFLARRTYRCERAWVGGRKKNEQFIYILLHKEKRVAEDEMVRDHH